MENKEDNFVRGQLLYLERRAGGVASGYYILLGRRGAFLRLAAAGLEREGRGIFPTTETVSLHERHAPKLRNALGIVVPLNGEARQPSRRGHASPRH